MIFGERSAFRKKSKDLRNEIKQLKKEMISAGCDKGRVTGQLKEFQEVMELGYALQSDYESARTHLHSAMEGIGRILEQMRERPAEEVRAYLLELQSDLNLVYHDCSIRKDDTDFQSTMECFIRMVREYENGMETMSEIMLRSELENIRGVLEDAAGFHAPDFFALAYFYNHEDREILKDKENEQRNQFLQEYLKERFMNDFIAEMKIAGAEQKVGELIQSYIYG